MYTVFVLGILVVGYSGAVLRSDYYWDDERYSDVLPVSDILWSKSKELMHCVIDCSLDKDCEAVFYFSGKCYGYILKLHDFIPTTAATGMKYLELAGPVGNLAAGMPTKQSSILGNIYFGSEFAVDSRRYPLQGADLSLRSCSHTEEGGNGDDTPFWQVDLLALHQITSVSFLSRQECCGERNSGLNITVAESSAGPYNLCYYYPLGTGFVNEMKTFVCTQPLTGRLVRISREEPVINACEIEVYGYPLI